MSRSRVFSWISLSFLVCVVIAVLLWPTGVDANISPSVHRVVRWLNGQGADMVTYRRVEFLANVAMFAPLGFLIAYASRNPAFSVAFGIALSACGELAQARFLDNRVSSLRDVLANALGTAFGVVIAILLNRYQMRKASGRDIHSSGDVTDKVGGARA